MIIGKPADGYTSSAKQQYRKSVWDFVAANVRKPIAERKVAIVDTAAAFETKHLLKLGYAAENITVINRDPHEFANRYTGTQLLCGDVFHVLRNIQGKRLPYCTVNLDLCGPYSFALARNIRTVAARLRPGSVIAVTMWRRSMEPAGTFPIDRPPSARLIQITGRADTPIDLPCTKDQWRLLYTAGAFGINRIDRLRYGMYNKMFWIAARLR